MFSRQSQFIMTRWKNTLTHHWHHSQEMCVFSFSCVLYTNFISPACFDEILLFFFLSLCYLFFFNFKILRFENKYINPNLWGFLDSGLYTRSPWVEEEVNYKWEQMWICKWECEWVTWRLKGTIALDMLDPLVITGQVVRMMSGKE